MVAAILMSAVGLSCSSSDYSKPRDVITIGTTVNENNTLIYVARDKDYFSDNGLDVTIKTYASGNAALDGMLKGEIDIATGSEYALAAYAMRSSDIKMVANINRGSVEYLVGRMDRGIASLPDVKGKKVGVPLKSRPEFALDRFFYFNGIDSSSVSLVNVPVDKSVEALANGEVDAVATWQPYIDRIRDRLGNGVVAWSVQSNQPSYNGVMCRGEWVREHQDTISRLLKSLIQAEGLVVGDVKAAKEIVLKTLNYDETYVDSVWPDNFFSLSLDQSIIIAMEDEARWMIKSNLTTERQLPDFTDCIYEDALKAIKPGAVNIIR